MALHILGIRHHGVGSAKNVLQQLTELKPDIILVEGPPEITEVLSLAGSTEMVPPVAIMIYNPDDPKESTFYPFAEYSPEWVAVKYALKNNIPVRTMDLPASVSFFKRRPKAENPAAESTNNKDIVEIDPDSENSTQVSDNKPIAEIKDPLSYLSDIEGFKNSEEWWEYHFEQHKSNPAEHFESVMHVMEALRTEGVKSSLDEENIEREAYMRMLLRQAENEMFENIAVVCGAWHAPALSDLKKTSKPDNALIKALPKTKIKINATWIPWTNSRLSMFSGYGAGITSPGWYEHQWQVSENSEISWLTKVANAFRVKDMDISTAHLIEAYKLAHSLASLRNKYFISLDELNEAVLSVMCMGDGILLELIKDKLITGNKIGSVPENIPKVPLQEDFERTIKALRLKLTADQKEYDLDLRKENDLDRSILFHRLEIIGIPWAKASYSRTKGTFKESWVVVWSPEMMIGLIDKSYLGNTLEFVAQAIITDRCKSSVKISDVADLIQLSIPSKLFESIDTLLARINELSSISADIVDLMNAIPRLVDISRYGDVRKSDLRVLNVIVQQLLIKVFVGLPNACYGLDEDNSNQMFGLISKLNNAVRLYEDVEIQQQWYETLHQLIDKTGVHPIILGCVCRLLLDARELTDDEADRRISYSLSVNNDPHYVASWIEGFLRGSGMILIYDNHLWNLIYSWVSSLSEEVFIELLPLMRRSFSKFEYGERRQIGAKAKKGIANLNETKQLELSTDFDYQRAEKVLNTVILLIG
jgi:hypothetical protein